MKLVCECCNQRLPPAALQAEAAKLYRAAELGYERMLDRPDGPFVHEYPQWIHETRTLARAYFDASWGGEEWAP